MEANTTPQSSGFSGKPNSKFKKSSRGSKGKSRNAVVSARPRITPKEAKSIIYGSLFLLAVATQLHDLFAETSGRSTSTASAK